MKKQVPVNHTKLAKEEALQNSRNEITYSAYELSILRSINKYKEFIWFELIFTVIIITSVAVFVMALRNHYFGLRFICYGNIFLACLYLFVILMYNFLDDLNQIKYGYYLFFINTIAIIVLSKKEIRTQNGLRTAHYTPPHTTENNT